MKELFKNAVLFIFLALVFSSFNGCSTSSPSTSENSAATNSEGSTATKKPSEYPPIASAVANADIKNLDGSTFKLADKKGKVVLLNLWATWCGPCRSEMPALVRMQDEHRANGFEIIGLDTDDEEVDAINKFAAQMNLNYTLTWADTNLQNELLKISKFDGIPQSFLVDRDGNLRGVFRGANPSDVRKMEDIVSKVVNE